MAKQSADVVIIGAGVIGLAAARELCRLGARVTVFDAARPGRGASWAAAGMLSPFSVSSGDDAIFELCDASFSLFPPLADALREETGIDIEYRPHGKLHVFGDDAGRERLDLRASVTPPHFGLRFLDGADMRALEPALPESIAGALHVARDATVNNRLLTQALVAAGAAEGVRFRHPRAVARIRIENGRVTGVRTSENEDVACETVVLAAGAQSGTLHGLPRPLPVRPVRGQMFAVDSHGLRLHNTIESEACYIVPRADGRLLVGATLDNVEYEPGPTPRGLAAMMQAGMELLPQIGALPVVETWHGYRPAATDDLPIIGRDPDVPGLIYATGHYRNGILLAPITAQCIADIVMGTHPAIDVDAFRPDRFAS